MNAFDRKEYLAAMVVRQTAIELASKYCSPEDMQAGVTALLSKAMETDNDRESRLVVDSLEYPSP